VFSPSLLGFLFYLGPTLDYSSLGCFVIRVSCVSHDLLVFGEGHWVSLTRPPFICYFDTVLCYECIHSYCFFLNGFHCLSGLVIGIFLFCLVEVGRNVRQLTGDLSPFTVDYRYISRPTATDARKRASQRMVIPIAKRERVNIIRYWFAAILSRKSKAFQHTSFLKDCYSFTRYSTVW